MKTEWIIFGVAALLIFGASQASDKQFKKTGADDVMFRASDVYYGISSQIAFNLACDGSDLDRYEYAKIGSYQPYSSCEERYGSPIIEDLPNNANRISDGFDGTYTCLTPLNLYQLSSSRYVVCCSFSSTNLRATEYEWVAGTTSAISLNVNSEKMCPAGPVPCAIQFTDFTNYANNWVSCGPNTC